MAFKNERRVVEKRSVFIGTEPEATRIVNDYGTMGTFDFQKKYGCTMDEGRVLVYAACAYLLSVASRRVVNPNLFEELGVKRIPDGPAEPTWTSSNGETTRLRDLPTTYLSNVRRFAARMVAPASDHGSGLLDAIDTELARRSTSAA